MNHDVNDPRFKNFAASGHGANSLIAILRGITTEHALDVGRALYDLGFRCIEVPLNSPDALESIACLAAQLPSDCLVGAGTVLRSEQVGAVHECGAQLVVSPNMDRDVIAATKSLGMVSVPGCATPTECFAALAAGADMLKIFPAEGISHPAIRAMRVVLPPATKLALVGSVEPQTIRTSRREYPGLLNAWGLGGALYQPGQDAADVVRRAKEFVHAVKARAPEKP